MEDPENCGISVFEDMDGFEGFNPMDDSSLNEIFDDLQEGTLLSMLNEQVFDDPASYQNGVYAAQQTEECVQRGREELDVHKLFSELNQSVCSINGLSEDKNVLKHHEHRSQINDPSNPVQSNCVSPILPSCQTTRKRVRRDSCEDSLGSKEEMYVMSPQHLLECVHHDHCYVVAGRKECHGNDRRGSLSEGSVQSTSSESLEEGNNSDGGRYLRQLNVFSLVYPLT